MYFDKVKTVLTVIGCVVVYGINAQQGSLDISFNTSGVVTTSIGSSTDVAYGMTEQSDGKIIIAGKSFNGSDYDFAVARYNTDGVLDLSFGSGGQVVTDILGSTDEAAAVQIQNDGKILVAGLADNGMNYDYCVVRYLSDGSLDSTFDSDGIALIPIGSSFDFATGMILKSNGKIYITGYAFITSGFDFATIRLNTDGSLDNTFGTNGIVITDFGSGDDNAHCIALKSNGKIVIAGVSNSKFAMAQYNDDGLIDNSFGTSGKVTTAMGVTSAANCIAIQSNNKIVLGGHSASSAGSKDFAIARYNSDGALDASFDGDGKIVTSFFAGDDICYTILFQPDGKILAGGCAYNLTNFDFALARYNSDGSTDMSFNSTGKVISTIGPDADIINAFLLDNNGKLLAAGSTKSASIDFALARYITGITIGLDEINTSGISVFPNPIQNCFRINFQSDQSISASLYDYNGRLVERFDNVYSNQLSYLPEEVPDGLYYLVLKSKDIEEVIKVVIQ